MGEESPKPASAPTGAVFLSYASQDAEAAARICNALRAAGIEVWFDQSELRGGDAWDQKIRREIHECALFIPVISANTTSRREGYFRLEWDLAGQRSHRMARDQAFIVPVCLDATPGAGTDVPESFHRVHWTRLPAGETPPAFVERVRRLLSPEAPAATRPPASTMPGAAATVGEPIRASRWAKPLLLAIVAVVGFAALAYVMANKFWVPKHATPETAARVSAAPVGFAPPPHSIAVLPFVNMSGDKEQEYFSEGLTEELLNSLSRISDLQVAARTSSFSFQGEHPDISTVAHKLNVGAVLEGSVRRSSNTVRITAQLVNGVTGFHLWSETYDRDLGDVLRLQTEIATAVAGALKVTLLGNEAAKIEAGGTHSPAAFDAYLRGSKAFLNRHGAPEVQAAITAYTDAIQLDPKYALAFAARSLAYSDLADWWTADSGAVNEAYGKAQSDARAAISLAPDLAEGHLALADVFSDALEFRQASEEFERAAALAPGNAQVFQTYSDFAAGIGRLDAGIGAAQRAVLLDPLNAESRAALATAFSYARRYDEAMTAYQAVLALDPEFSYPYDWLYSYELGKLEEARAWCEKRPNNWGSRVGLAVIYHKMGRHADAEAELLKYKAGNASQNDWYQYAQIFAQWGDTSQALSYLERALSVRHPALYTLKTDLLLDPLRNDPRFQAIERKLKFPN